MSENINEIAGVEPSFKIDELKFNEKGPGDRAGSL